MAWSTSNGRVECDECGASAPVPRSPCSCPAATTTTPTTDEDLDEFGADLSASALAQHLMKRARYVRDILREFSSHDANNATTAAILKVKLAAVDTERKLVETAARIRTGLEQVAAIRRYGAIVERFESRRDGPQHEGAN